MATTEFNTHYMIDLIDRMQQGDNRAGDELLRAVQGNLERLARKMLRGFPQVSRWEAPEDVMQNAAIRLLRSLREVSPKSTRDFFNLAATQIRRELIDLARHYQGPLGLANNYDSAAIDGIPSGDGKAAIAPTAPATDHASLDRWYMFHLAVENLPTEEREVVSLMFYHNWGQEQIAELFQVTDRTVRRWLTSARERLRDVLGDDLLEA